MPDTIENLTLIEFAGKASLLVWNEGGKLHWVGGDDGQLREIIDAFDLPTPEWFRISDDHERVWSASTNQEPRYASRIWSLLAAGK